MKKILGLDLGTNSIGWALVSTDESGNPYKIDGMNSRIIPMNQDVLDTFSGGKPLETQTAARTGYRGTRRLRERHLLRRERLHRVLNILGFLPEHYAKQIDFEKRLGQFFEEKEPKIVWEEDENGKFDFLFQKSFLEMVEDFKKSQPKLLENNNLIPYDWTIYYLRNKALQQKIEKEELAWIILNFNQKRGYYQLRGEEEEENPNKLVEYYALKVVDITANEPQKGKTDIWYNVVLENGWIYRRSSKNPLFDWVGKEKEFIVTTDLNDDGTIKIDKEGVEKRSFRAPSEDDWSLLKKKTEADIIKSRKTVGTYIYETLLSNPKQKIRGKLVRTIERKFYKDELKQILAKQIELQPKLFSDDLYNDCIRELYRNNEAHQLILSKRDFVHLFLSDIIFYQRPLRSQKSTIGNCTLEFRTYKDKDGKKITEYLKTIPKSNPLYQEFRVWQWLSNLKIYRKGDDEDVTSQFIKEIDDVVNLFEFLMLKKEVNHKDILQHFLTKEGFKGKYLNAEIAKYRWNYVFDNSKDKEEDKSKKYPCNTTGSEIRRRLEKVENVSENFFTPEIEQKLWHIIYSVTDKIEFETALKTFAEKHNLDVESFVENFKKFPPFKSEYGAFSEKAIKKLLPLMRLGKYWNEDDIKNSVIERANSIKCRLSSIDFDEKKIDTTSDDDIPKQVLKSFLKQANFTQGLQLYQASYLVYGRYSEADVAGKWNSVADLEAYLKEFKQHSLRNPIVEQIITETLRVVKDIWKEYGEGAKDFFDEIHVELGREMKNTAEDRKWLTEQVTNNENTNLRIKALLMELKENTDGKLFTEDVRPHSPMQQDALKIFEEYALQNNERYDAKENKFVYAPIEDDILKISKSAQPTKSELQRYKLWLEQRYRSPYTGQMIPLGRLFTEDYQIEHIIPKSRYFDDSFNNKVICESAVNQLKDKQLGLEFIQNHYGEEVPLGMGKCARIFTEDEYKDFVKEHYTKNNSKRRNLLLDEIPEQMIARQMNDTRYISKFISELLSNIVRAEKEDDGINSKNLIPVTGKITTILKQDWGMNDVWNDLILPRFERMNELTNSQNFTSWNDNYQKYLPTVPLELSKNFQKKRIDHRHHAMDALVIACATRDHVNLLNNQSAKSENSRYDLQNKLRHKEKESWIDKKTNEKVERDVFKEFKKPWDNFTVDAKNELKKIIVSFKQNLRIINKTTNKYEKFVDGKKAKVSQQGTNWAIRKPLHKDTVSGIVNLRLKKTVNLSAAINEWENIVDKNLKTKIKQLINEGIDKKKIQKFFAQQENKWQGKDISKLEVYYFSNDKEILVASRSALDVSFNSKKIESITDSGIQKILLRHLEKYNEEKEGKIVERPDLAFSSEGIEDMNKNIIQLNEGKQHQPILKVRTYEPKGNKFNVGSFGNKKDKFVEAAKGTNLFFAIYVDDEGKRSYETIPLNIVVERLKQGLKEVPEVNEKGNKLLFHLSPNDLVYVPTEEEIESGMNYDKKQIYKIVSFTGNRLYAIPYYVAKSIVDKQEYTQLNKVESDIMYNSSIKTTCLKIKIDRLGNITK
jgi:Uncharacterized protein conserved in bacteria